MSADELLTIDEVIRAQRLRRRLRFFAVVAVIVVVGGLWAGLSKDPLREGFILDGDPGPDFAEEPVEFFDGPITTVTFLEFEEGEG